MSAPVHHISGVQAVDVCGDLAIVTLESFGAEMRLSLTRSSVMFLATRLGKAGQEMFDHPPREAEIIPMKRAGEAK